ncbi:MAG TPA: hypothetical protein ENN29_14055 [Candidatus Hydrogenedentes bacterium]|nr:hypothetical protein [Candidatus Hydrogenedentota bacterium]
MTNRIRYMSALMMAALLTAPLAAVFVCPCVTQCDTEETCCCHADAAENQSSAEGACCSTDDSATTATTHETAFGGCDSATRPACPHAIGDSPYTNAVMHAPVSVNQPVASAAFVPHPTARGADTDYDRIARSFPVFLSPPGTHVLNCLFLC